MDGPYGYFPRMYTALLPVLTGLWTLAVFIRHAPATDSLRTGAAASAFDDPVPDRISSSLRRDSRASQPH